LTRRCPGRGDLTVRQEDGRRFGSRRGALSPSTSRSRDGPSPRTRRARRRWPERDRARGKAPRALRFATNRDRAAGEVGGENAAHGNLAPAIACARDGFAVTDRSRDLDVDGDSAPRRERRSGGHLLADVRRRGPDSVCQSGPRSDRRAHRRPRRRGFYEARPRERWRASPASTAASSPRTIWASSAPAGRAGVDDLSGRDDLRDAAADQGISVWEMLNLIEPTTFRASTGGSGRRAPSRPGEADRLPRSRPAHRRSGFLQGAGGAARIEGVTRTSAARSSTRRARFPGIAFPSHGSLEGDTVAVCAVDGDGNAAALIHSVYGTYGRGGGGAHRRRAPEPERLFQLDPTHPNRLEPGKIPLPP